MIFFLPILLFSSWIASATPMPTEEELRGALEEAYHLFIDNTEGSLVEYTDDVPPVAPDQFGIAITSLDGTHYEVGDSKSNFAIQSICKPFIYGLALEDRGRDTLFEKVGVEPTGMPYNSIIAIRIRKNPSQNPSVNAGAITSTSLIQASSKKEKWKRLLKMFEAYAGRPVKLDQKVYQSEVKQSHINQALSQVMHSLGSLEGDPTEAVDSYLRACSLNVNALDLSVIAATLANRGVNPKTGKRALQDKYVRDVLSVMLVSGLYDNSGEWMFRVGLPAKSGVGGGILVVVPGKLGIGIFSPRLDPYGNSVRGELVSKYLSKRFRFHILDPREHKHDWVPKAQPIKTRSN